MKAIMYGAGSIGRGFIGALLSEIGYEVVFIDVNDQLVDTINQEKTLSTDHHEKRTGNPLDQEYPCSQWK